MKNLIYVVAFLLLAFSANGQQNKSLKKSSDSFSISPGLMFNPQGTISLQYPEDGFQELYPLQAIVSLNKGNTYLIPFYTLGENSIGSYLVQSFETLDIYLIGVKDTYSRETYAGLGIDLFIGENENQSIFLEFGNSMYEEVNWDPYFTIGLSLSFTKKIGF